MASVNKPAPKLNVAKAPVAPAARKPVAAADAKAQAWDPFPHSDDPATLGGWMRDRYDANKYKTEYRLVWDDEDEEYEYQPVTVTIPRDGQLDRKEWDNPHFSKVDALRDANGYVSINEMTDAFQKMDPALRANILKTADDARRKVADVSKENPRAKEGWLSAAGLGGAAALGVGAGLLAASIPALAIGLGVAAAGAGIFGLFNLVKVIGKSNHIGDAQREGERAVDEAINRGFSSI